MRRALYTLVVIFTTFALSCSTTKHNKDQSYVTPEQIPFFPGGENAMYEYLKENLVYPEDAINNYIEGRVVLRFVVEKNGSITNIEIVKGMNPMCDKEAVRVVKSMPRWVPARQSQKPISAYFTLPILFKLTEKATTADKINNN